jgi:hypothetical protein
MEGAGIGAGSLGVSDGIGNGFGGSAGGGVCCPNANAAPSISAKGTARTAARSKEPVAPCSVLRAFLTIKVNLIPLE